MTDNNIDLDIDTINSIDINNKINSLTDEINRLKVLLKKKESKKETIQNSNKNDEDDNKLNEIIINKNIDISSLPSSLPSPFYNTSSLSNTQISRYSRHLILPDLTITSQEKICKSSVLVIGCGGLGSTVILYLASCGIGKLGLLDYDKVEISNLHRQIVHNEKTLGLYKTESSKLAASNINSSIEIETINEQFTNLNAIKIVQNYDIIVDASDNAATRYLINDAAITCGKPLVSGAALGLEGQITVYGAKNDRGRGPCYRCLFPKPPPPETVPSCANAGVLGVVPGLIGCFQALEVLKIAGEFGEPLIGRMLMLDSLSSAVRNIKMRLRNPACAVCGDEPTITKEKVCEIQYEVFCNSASHDRPVENKEISTIVYDNISCKDYSDHIVSQLCHMTLAELTNKELLLDVRDTTQYAICSLPNSINIPLKELASRINEVKSRVKPNESIYVMCRRGVLSKKASTLLAEMGMKPINVIGGITSWKNEVDPNFPLY